MKSASPLLPRLQLHGPQKVRHRARPCLQRASQSPMLSQRRV
jgi:hypothetical protein